VYIGAEDGIQVVPFKSAWFRSKLYTKGWTIEYMNTRYINESAWSPQNLVDWLLDSDVHFILTHVHQGIGKYLQWDMVDLEENLQRLRKHPGFPNGEQLMCPVFLQDKYNYLNKLPFSTINDTYKIFLTADDDYFSFENTACKDLVSRFYFYAHY
jgi:hypothetical protein